MYDRVRSTGHRLFIRRTLSPNFYADLSKATCDATTKQWTFFDSRTGMPITQSQNFYADLSKATCDATTKHNSEKKDEKEEAPNTNNSTADHS
ncbi:hypothetical protein PRIPAC_87019 [Pristionchus pacificus]|uniref:Uncharacterized protein n=1 Tax=Pristionchus pacificus TaxID=54126 RepID=A0A2A6BT08_PRIPA|nr:hypothetical protein PRIPAC_85374 [Pristionchus pacificus]KAF8369190.1 hypothetical protein PRIPAC_87019 [Pristionchus pacificus]|eukprot:PDM68837.1 hypothetical protein PRIPAC_47139 [Pristionchus pacificus]